MYYIIGFAIFMILYYVITNLCGSKPPAKKEEQTRYFTREELRKYDGKSKESGGKVYVGCKDYVFDVSASPFYTEGGDYEIFGGRDITVACAYHSKSEEHLS